MDGVMGWMKWLGLLVATLTVLVVGLMAYGSWRWNEGTTALLARLEAARVPHAVARYDARELQALPRARRAARALAVARLGLN